MRFALTIFKTLSALMASVALLMFGNSMFSTLLALRANIENYPNEMIGLMTSGYFLGFILGTFRSGTLINRIGHIRAFAAFSALASASALMVLVLIDPWSWVVLRIVMGAASAGLFMVAESWLNNRATNQSRGVLLSLYIMVGYIASALGQKAIQFSNPGSYEIFLVVGAVFSLSLIPVALTRATHPDPVETPILNIRRLIEASPTSVVGCLVAGLISASWWGLGPVYAREIGLSIDEISNFMAAGLLGGLFLQLPVGRISDKLDRRLVLFWVTIGTSVPALLLCFGSVMPIWILFFLVAASFGLSSTLYPLSMAYANDYLESSEVVAACGGFVLIFGLGAVIGPLISSFSMRIYGAEGMYVFMFIATLLLALFVVLRMRVRQWAPIIEKEPYVPQPELQTPGLISSLDPRAEIAENYDLGPDTLDVTTEDSLIKE